jgi:hypothetical protein
LNATGRPYLFPALVAHLLPELTVFVLSHLLSALLDHPRHSTLRPESFPTTDPDNRRNIVSAFSMKGNREFPDA